MNAKSSFRPSLASAVRRPAWMRMLVAVALAVSAGVAGMPAQAQVPAQDRPVVRVASLALPVFAPIVWNIMKERGFDAKNGFDLQIKRYPSISAYYAGFATGEVDALFGGPSNFQKLRTEGVPVKIVTTGLRLSDLVVFTRDPAIKSLADLRGKQLAVDTGGSQYQVLAIYAKANGLSIGKDITAISGNFAVSRAQLEAGRVDAAMIAEPMATMISQQNPDWKIIFNGGTGWKELTGNEGWEIVSAMREDSIQRAPDTPRRLTAALQDVAAFIRTDLDAADRIANQTVKLPLGVLKAAVTSKRWDFDVRPVAGAERKVVWDMFERAVAAGFHPKLPDEGIIHAAP